MIPPERPSSQASAGGPAPGRQGLPNLLARVVLAATLSSFPFAPLASPLPPPPTAPPLFYCSRKRADRPQGRDPLADTHPLCPLAPVLADWGCPSICCQVALGVKGCERGRGRSGPQPPGGQCVGTSGSLQRKGDSERHMSNRSDILVIPSADRLLRGSGPLTHRGPCSSRRPTKGAARTPALRSRGS